MSADLVIVGGGLVGASLALALHGSGLRCVLIEARAQSEAPPNLYDARSTALSASSVRVLDTLGLWRAVAPHAAAIRQIHVSERGRFGLCRLEAAEFGVDALGHVVENAALATTLWQALQQADAEVLAPASLISIERAEDELTLRVREADGERTLRTRLLVAADGVRSTVRELLGLPSSAWDYRTSAVIANVTPERPRPGVAFERFTPSGPLALLPLYDERYALVWTLPSDQAETTAALSDAAFRAALQHAFGFRLGRFARAGRRDLYPLALTLGEQPAGGRVVLVGNAAQGLHPVAGQGFNLGLRDAAALAEVLSEARLEAGEAFDAGAAALLERYRQWRGGDQRRAVMLTDGLVRLFTNPLASVALARNSGMLLLDLLPPLKSAFAEHAMGMGMRLPRLARGVALLRDGTNAR